MYTTKSINSNSTINIDYCDFTNTIEIHVGNESGFRFVSLDIEQCDLIIEQINNVKNSIL